MDTLPDDLQKYILTHIHPCDIAPLLWVSRRWRTHVKAHLHRHTWSRLDSQLHASFITIASPRVREKYLVRYSCHMHTPCYYLQEKGRYRCARCGRARHDVGMCPCRPLSTLLRRAMLGPCVAAALVAVALSLPVEARSLLPRLLKLKR